MSTKVEIKEEDEYISINVVGPYEAQNVRSFLEGIRKLCETTKKSRILIDSTQVTEFPKGLANFLLGEELARFLGNEIKLANICKQENFDDLLGENAAVNRGARVKVFTGRATALKWLFEK